MRDVAVPRLLSLEEVQTRSHRVGEAMPILPSPLQFPGVPGLLNPSCR